MECQAAIIIIQKYTTDIEHWVLDSKVWSHSFKIKTFSIIRFSKGLQYP